MSLPSNNIKESEIIEDYRAYYSIEYGERILQELFHNSFRTIMNVYLFRHFDDYIIQLKSDKNEDKKDIYWNASYYEKLTDYIKISIAFENYNKAVLIKNGYLVHKIQKNKYTKDLYKLQNNGIPVKVNEFRKLCDYIFDRHRSKYYLDGLNKSLQTINYSDTLNVNYQKIIGLDTELLGRLKELNIKRNKLHFFTDFKGAFIVNSHIEKWKYIKEKSIETIECETNNYCHR